ncbi:hypothetical protein BRC95_09985 [Halobacteriales archaeon QS_5_68_33]|nr:MAG: hypothetical protein BRC95_09985 [Halobacteriales archaeon QS_5_68_33]
MPSVSAVELAAAGVALLAALAAGMTAHELAHALAYRLLSVPCTITFLPDRTDPPAAGGLGRLATVRPTGRLDRLSPWRLRVAAVAPLCLVAPFVLVPLGAAADPFALGNPAVAAAAVGWAACSLPSPQDFALVWYPERALARGRDRGAGTPRS